MIRINVINCDGHEDKWKYENLEQLKKEWYKKEGYPKIPMLDDELIYGEIDGEEVQGETAMAVFEFLKEKYRWNY